MGNPDISYDIPVKKMDNNSYYAVPRPNGRQGEDTMLGFDLKYLASQGCLPPETAGRPVDMSKIQV